MPDHLFSIQARKSIPEKLLAGVRKPCIGNMSVAARLIDSRARCHRWCQFCRLYCDDFLGIAHVACIHVETSVRPMKLTGLKPLVVEPPLSMLPTKAAARSMIRTVFFVPVQDGTWVSEAWRVHAASALKPICQDSALSRRIPALHEIWKSRFVVESPLARVVSDQNHSSIPVRQLITRISALNPSQARASTSLEASASSSAQKRIPQHLFVAG